MDHRRTQRTQTVFHSCYEAQFGVLCVLRADFSICMVFGRALSISGFVDYGDPEVYIKVLLLWPLFTAFMCFLLSWIGGFHREINPWQLANKIAGISRTINCSWHFG